MSVAIFRHRHRVTYAECTAGNHVYYARYLDLLEAGRGEFFRELGTSFLQWQQADTIFPVIECRVRHHAAARYDDVLTVEIWVTELGRVRLAFGYRILNEAGREILNASTQHACTSLDEKLKRIPQELSDRLRPYLRQPNIAADASA